MDMGHQHHDHSQDHYHHHGNAHEGHQGHVAPTLHPHIGGHQHDVAHQTFFNSRFNVTVLFSPWVLNTRTDVFIACLVTCLLAVGYQGTKWLRQYLHRHYAAKRHSIKSKEHLLQTLLYVFEFLSSYILMLIVMTYNIWVFVVTILGLGVGYFLIGWHRRPPSKPQCQEVCPSVSNQTTDPAVRAKSYEKTSPDQELLPLDNGAPMCGNCSCEAEIERIRETDILT